MSSFIVLHKDLSLKVQRGRVRLVLDYYKNEPAVGTLRVYASEDLTEVFEREAALHFVMGYAACLKNFKEATRSEEPNEI